jgi:hypothetical protein
MMFFRNSRKINENLEQDLSKSPIVDFFNKRNKDEIARLVCDVSLDAKDFFESSAVGLLGHLPNDVAHTSITLNKDALNQLIFSAMITGYLTKSIEDKINLEKLFDDAGLNNKGAADKIFDKIHKDKLNEIL